jgi:hypothetical protein
VGTDGLSVDEEEEEGREEDDDEAEVEGGGKREEEGDWFASSEDCPLNHFPNPREVPSCKNA